MADIWFKVGNYGELLIGDADKISTDPSSVGFERVDLYKPEIMKAGIQELRGGILPLFTTVLVVENLFRKV
jgi:hypothetical protein